MGEGKKLCYLHITKNSSRTQLSRVSNKKCSKCLHGSERKEIYFLHKLEVGWMGRERKLEATDNLMYPESQTSRL